MSWLMIYCNLIWYLQLLMTKESYGISSFNWNSEVVTMTIKYNPTEHVVRLRGIRGWTLDWNGLRVFYARATSRSSLRFMEKHRCYLTAHALLSVIFQSKSGLLLKMKVINYNQNKICMIFVSCFRVWHHEAFDNTSNIIIIPLISLDMVWKNLDEVYRKQV